MLPASTVGSAWFDHLPHVPISMLNLPIHPTFMSVKADSSKVFVGIGGQPNLVPSLRVQPFLHKTQELPPDAPSLVFPEDSDHPYFTGLFVAHGETHLSPIHLTKPSPVRMLHHLPDRLGSNAHPRHFLTTVAVVPGRNAYLKDGV
jgi:hypothetical protein